jgi:hypothetical protein
MAENTKIAENTKMAENTKIAENTKMAENTNMDNLISMRKQIIRTFNRRSLRNQNQTDIIGHAIVITDIIKDDKEKPILINEHYVYRFKNNWGGNWNDEGYGYCTLQSFNISEICFFIDNENSKEIDTLINSISVKKIYTTIVAPPNKKHSKRSINVVPPNNSIRSNRYQKRIKMTLDNKTLDNKVKLLNSLMSND